MHSRLKTRLASVALFAAIFHLTNHSWALRVVIDPGHGGNDRGATLGKVSESNITLEIAKLVETELKKDSRFSVILTRNSDSYLTLEERADIGNKSGDVFLSIHVNSSPDSHLRGREIYFQNQLPSDEESLFLANRENQNAESANRSPRSVSFAFAGRKLNNPEVQAIVEDLERNHRFKLSGIFTEKLFYNWKGDIRKGHRAIRQAPFFVVSNVNKPAALIEIGYLTNPNEAKNLVDPSYQKKVAQGIYRALVSFKEFVDKPTNKSLD